MRSEAGMGKDVEDLGSLSSRNEFMILAEHKCTLQAVLPTDNWLSSPLGHAIEASKGLIIYQKYDIYFRQQYFKWQ